MPEQRRAFVAGATGYVGRAVVGELRARGVETVAHVRPDSPRLAEWRHRFEGIGARVDATAWDADALRSTLARVRPDLVFALLGTTRTRSRRAAEHGEPENYETVDYALSALLLDAARASAPGARFVYLSSMGAGPKASGAYLQARWKVEQALHASGMEHVIARPSFITGPGREERRRVERAAAWLLDAGLAVLAAFGARRTRERYRSTDNTELARALVELALDPDAANGTFEAERLRRRAD